MPNSPKKTLRKPSLRLKKSRKKPNRRRKRRQSRKE